MHLARFCLVLLVMLASAGASVSRAEEPAWFGASVETVTPAMMAEQGLAVPFGARVTAVEPDSPAAKAGLAEGDVVLSVNGMAVQNAAEFEGAIGKLAVGVVVDIMRQRGKDPLVPLKVTLAERPKPQSPQVAGTPPLLMLDTGGHMALIKDIAFTPDGTQLVSASADKTIRVWDLATGKTARFIRGEADQGDPGKIYAMALSPDGRWLATAGLLSGTRELKCAIRLYDFATGKLIGLLKGHDNVVNGLAFSPDGKYLISGSGDRDAIIWDVEQKSLKHRLEGHTAQIYAVGFTPDSARAVTGSNDNTLRLWSVADGSEIAHMIGPQDNVYALAVAPDGRIASGDDSGKIWLWDGKTGEFIEILAQQESDISSLSFSPDGKLLLSGAGSLGSSSKCFVFDVSSGDIHLEYDKHDNLVRATAISPDGRWAATGGGDNQEIHIWDLKTGEPRRRANSEPLILKGAGKGTWSVGFSDDGRRIAWGSISSYQTHNDRGPLKFALTLPIGDEVLGRPVTLTEDEAKRFRRAEIVRGSLSLSHRKGGLYDRSDAILEIRDGDQLLAAIERDATDGIRHRSYTFAPDGKAVVSSGANGALFAYGLDGRTLGEFVGHTSDVWAVTASANGRYLVTAGDDQTVRLWNLATRELIVTLFHGSDGEWVMWTPQGYYTGSPGAGELVGWQINQGSSKEAQYVRGRQLRDKLLRPDIVERAIQLASAEAALEQAGLANVSVETLLLPDRTPPVLHAKAWASQATGGRGIVLVALEKNALPVLETRITVSDGKQETTVEPRAVAWPDQAPRLDPGMTPRAYEVPLYKGENTVRIVAINAAGESEPREAAITHNGDGALDKRGTLWVLAVGVNDYRGAQRIVDQSGKAFAYRNLNYADADAADFAATVEAQMQSQHTNTEVTVLVNGGKDGEPTRANILTALQRIRESSAATDTIVILLAGHGENWTGGRYHFLPTDFARTSMAEIGENVIDWQNDVQPAITGAKGRKILFFDACHSANARNQTLLPSAEADRYVAFASAGPGQDSVELDELKHGVFTYMLLKALKGAQEALDRGKKGVTVYTLGAFLSSTVSERTLGRQEPEYRSGSGNLVLTRM